jgi:hypothetical protein
VCRRRTGSETVATNHPAKLQVVTSPLLVGLFDVLADIPITVGRKQAADSASSVVTVPTTASSASSSASTSVISTTSHSQQQAPGLMTLPTALLVHVCSFLPPEQWVWPISCLNRALHRLLLAPPQSTSRDANVQALFRSFAHTRWYAHLKALTLPGKLQGNLCDGRFELLCGFVGQMVWSWIGNRSL